MRRRARGEKTIHEIVYISLPNPRQDSEIASHANHHHLTVNRQTYLLLSTRVQALNKVGGAPPPVASPANVVSSPSGVNTSIQAFDSVDELLGEMLLAQAYILLTNSKVPFTTRDQSKEESLMAWLSLRSLDNTYCSAQRSTLF